MSKADRIPEIARSQIGSPYVFGTWGETCTPALRKKYAGYNPSHKDAIYKNCPVLSDKQSSCTGCRYDRKLAFDCRGFVHWVFDQIGINIYGGGCTTQWNTASNWMAKGKRDTMPSLICVVYQEKNGKFQHCGIYIGDGRTVECQLGVQERQMDSRWTHWAIPKGLYTEEEIKKAGILMQTLRKGSRGDEVKALQEKLNALGYDCGEADGIYGTKTENAVKDFQEDHNLSMDGICGQKTWEAIEKAENPEPVVPVITLEDRVTALENKVRDIEEQLKTVMLNCVN